MAAVGDGGGHPVCPGPGADPAWTGLKGVEPEEWLESWQPQEEVEELEQQRDETMKTIIEEECSAYIVDKAARLGAECQVEVL